MNEILVSIVIMALIAVFLSIALIFSSKKFYVPENPIIDEVAAMLPQANCGACGFPGCAGFAKAFVETQDKNMRCPAASAEILKAIGKIAGVETSEKQPMKAVLMCNGNHFNATKVSEYIGVRSCEAAHALYTGDKACSFSCIGYGDCVKACLFGAITTVNGIAVFNKEKCTGCGLCVKACPRRVITLVQKRLSTVHIACSSRDGGQIVKRNCKSGCIACARCVKVCPKGAIILEPGSNLAKIDDSKCVLCGRCVAECDVMHSIQAEGKVVKAVEMFAKKKRQEKEEKLQSAQAGSQVVSENKEVNS